MAAAFSLPVFVISMLPGFQFPHWGWVVAVLSLPVVTWAAWPFHRSAAINARHLTSTMDTLVSLGVSAGPQTLSLGWGWVVAFLTLGRKTGLYYVFISLLLRMSAQTVLPSPRERADSRLENLRT